MMKRERGTDWNGQSLMVGLLSGHVTTTFVGLFEIIGPVNCNYFCDLGETFNNNVQLSEIILNCKCEGYFKAH